MIEMKIRAKLLEGSSGGDIVGWGIGNATVIDELVKVSISTWKWWGKVGEAGGQLPLGGAQLYNEYNKPIGLVSDFLVKSDWHHGLNFDFSGRFTATDGFQATTRFLEAIAELERATAPSQ